MRPAATTLFRAAAIPLLAMSASGCFMRAQARTVPEIIPALNVPVPPPRTVDMVEPAPMQPGALVEEPARNTPLADLPRTEPLKPGAPKPEVIPAGVEAALEPEEVSRPLPTTTLQTTPPGAEAELERGIRALLLRATGNLNRIDYGKLHPDAKAQYDQSKRFVSQAEEALRVKNLLFAHNLADKAATLAVQLAGR